MDEDEIPEVVRGFILQHIESVAKIEALLLMRSQPQQAWDAALLARRLYVSAAQTGRIVSDLAAAGFIAPVPSQAGFYQFWPATPEIRDHIDLVAEVYARRLIPITNLIHQRGQHAPNRNLQLFADAFRLTKDKDKES